MSENKSLLNGFTSLPMMDNTEERNVGEMKFTFCEKNDRKLAEEIFQNAPEMINKSYGVRKSTNLHNAACRDRSSVVEFLVSKGAPCGKTDINGNTPLHIASVRGTCKTVELLLTPACILQGNIDGDYPIHVAAAAGNLPVVKLLLNYMTELKGSINCICEPHSCKSSEEDTPLHAAAQFGQVDVMRYLLDQGALVNARNKRGETPLHLAAGAKLRPAKPYHVQILLDYGATLDYKNNYGEQATFYAARTGTSEAFQLLLEKGAPVRKWKKVNGIFIQQDSKSDSLLRQVLNVGCEKKCRILLNKIMESRYKIKALESINEICIGRRSCLLNTEVTDQDFALSDMTKEIVDRPEDSESALRAILDINSTVAGSLFDRCIRMDQQDDRPIYTKVKFDLFLFEHKTAESTVIDLIIESGKLHLLQHPLIEIFIELKWYRTWKIFAFLMIFLFIRLITFALYLIFEFGPNYFDDQKCFIGERNVSDDNIASYKDFSGDNVGSYEHLNDAKFHISDDRCVSAVFRWITMVFSSISIIVVLFEWLYYIRNKIINRKRGLNYLCNSVEIYNMITYLKELVEPSLTLVAILFQSKSVGSLALILGTYNVLGNISRIPRMGSHVFMSGKVLRTITEFFFSYIFVILGYTITFHIAFHEEVETFSNLGDSLIKVMTMLLGEFDYSENFVAKSSDWMTRIFFVFFLVTMCITLMNLIVGLAIGDIKKMRKNANVYKQIGTLSGIKIVDEILVFFQYVPCLKKWIKQRRECNHYKIFLDLQEGRYCNAQKLHITDSKTNRSWSYGASRDTLKKVIDILKTTTHEGCLNEESHVSVSPHPSTDALVKVFERLERRIENLESKLDLKPDSNL